MGTHAKDMMSFWKQRRLAAGRFTLKEVPRDEHSKEKLHTPAHKGVYKFISNNAIANNEMDWQTFEGLMRFVQSTDIRMLRWMSNPTSRTFVGAQTMRAGRTSSNGSRGTQQWCAARRHPASYQLKRDDSPNKTTGHAVLHDFLNGGEGP